MVDASDVFIVETTTRRRVSTSRRVLELGTMDVNVMDGNVDETSFTTD